MNALNEGMYIGFRSQLVKISEDKSWSESAADNIVSYIGGSIAASPLGILGAASGQKSISTDRSALNELSKSIKRDPIRAAEELSKHMNLSKNVEVLESGIPGAMLPGKKVQDISKLLEKITGQSDILEEISAAISNEMGTNKEKTINAIKRGKNIVMSAPIKGNIDIYAHELGHASKVKSLLQRVALSPVGGIGSLAAMGMAIAGDEEKQKYAPVVAGVTQVPLLAEEARASVIGHQKLKELAHKKGINKDLIRKAMNSMKKNMTLAWGSYLGRAAAITAAPYLAAKIKNYLSEEY